MKIDVELVKEIARACLEQSTEALAREAELFSKTLPPDVSGQMALSAFAAAIRSTNAKVWPAKGNA